MQFAAQAGFVVASFDGKLTSVKLLFGMVVTDNGA